MAGSAAEAIGPGTTQVGGDIAAHLPRTSLEWLASDPERRHRRLQGALVFVDVAGFTALTERLAARGKAGAEEITEVIGEVFGELLAIASGAGGDLLKWGGDAVLLLFSGHDAARRAAVAAGRMQAAMAQRRRWKTSAGMTTLGVSIGAHAGPIDLYLLGSGHRELLVAGPGATATAAMEAAADAGEVLLSADLAAQLPPESLGPVKAGGVLLGDVPATGLLTAPPPPTGVPGDLAAALLSHDVVELLGSGVEVAEHRSATVGFLEFRGADELVERLGPEALVAHLELLVDAAQAAALRHEVHFHETDVSGDGGKIILLGGVPAARGRDAERLMRAVHDVVAGHPAGSPLQVRGGVNGGRVFVFTHEFAAARRRVFACTGDAMNLAARVMGKAAPGQALVTSTTLERAGRPFVTEAVAPFTVKGKSAPVDAEVLLAPAVRRSTTVDELAMVGRADDLAALVAFAADAVDGRGGAVVLTGPPGIGRRRLVAEARRHWALRTVTVVGDEFTTAAYAPVRTTLCHLLGVEPGDPDLLAALTAAVERHLPAAAPWLPLLADVMGVSARPTTEVEQLHPQFRRAQTELVAADLVEVLCGSPTAVVVEDAGLLDEPSAGVVARLADRAAEGWALLVVMVAADASVAGAGATELAIDVLGPGDAATLVRAVTGDELTPTQVERVVARSGGNPLYLRELAAAVALGRSADELPDTVEALMAAEIDRLRPADRQLLRSAAVVGTTVDLDLLAALLEHQAPTVEAWARLEGFGLLTTDGWRFRHALVRDAAYEGLSFRVRRQLHERAALAIESVRGDFEADADLLARHWALAERHDRAWHHARIAGRRAATLYANAEAAAQYERALAAARHLRLPRDEVAAVAEALGDVRELTADYLAARDAYRRARGLTDDPVARARLLRKVGLLHERGGRYPQAYACLTRGLRLLGGDSEAAKAEAVDVRLAVAGVSMRKGRYALAEEEAAHAAAAAQRAGLQRQVGHALYLRHLAGVYLGRPDRSLGERAVELFTSTGDLSGEARARNNLGIDAYYGGRWDEAAAHYRAAHEVFLRTGDVSGAASAEHNSAEILCDQGHLERARPMFESAHGAWRSTRFAYGQVYATANLGRLAARSGEPDVALAFLDEAEAIAGRLDSRALVAEVVLRRAEAQLLAGDARGATALLDGLDLGVDGVEQVALAALRLRATAAVLVATGRLAGAVRSADAAVLADRAVAAAVAGRAPFEEASARAVRALLGGAGASDDRARVEVLCDELGVVRLALCGDPDIDALGG